MQYIDMSTQCIDIKTQKNTKSLIIVVKFYFDGLYISI